jgi:hypothetical protein
MQSLAAHGNAMHSSIDVITRYTLQASSSTL